MNQFPAIRSRQPHREAWSKERLLHERAVALGNAIDRSTQKTYNSALNSYLNFVRLHDMPVDPNPESLSLFTVYMAHHINPKSVASYLTGILQQLEPYFPAVREARRSPLVTRTLKGCLRLKGVSVKRKRALTLEDLGIVIDALTQSSLHNDRLFLAMILTGFFALLRLGEMTFSNDKQLRNPRKLSKRSSVVITNDQYEFDLPAHKADRFFEGSRIIVRKDQFKHNPLTHFLNYLNSRDNLFPWASPLWLTTAGTVPTRHFFMNRLTTFFKDNVGGHSMRAGGATSLAEHGVPPSIIQPMGRWASDAFLIYIRKNPALVQALLYAGRDP
jgi:hypothetical protein